MAKRYCARCDKHLSTSKFYQSGKGYCIQCHRKYVRAYHEKNKETRNKVRVERLKLAKAEGMKFVQVAKQGRSCLRCGVKTGLGFYGAGKCRVSVAVNRGYSPTRLQEMMEKSTLVVAVRKAIKQEKGDKP